MRELLPRAPGTQRLSRFKDGETSELVESREYRGVLQSKFKPRVVCRDCNTGWMSLLDGATKPILRPLILGEKRHLTSEDQKILATWVCLKNMVAEFSDSKTIATSAVEAPDRHLSGRLANEEWFYLKTDRPSNWLKVVVAYVEGRGQIITAFARRSMP